MTLKKKITEIEKKMPFVKELVDVKHYSRLGRREATDVSYLETPMYQVVAAKIGSSMPMSRGGVEWSGHLSVAWKEKGSDKLYAELDTPKIITRDGYDGSGKKDRSELMSSHSLELSLHPEKKEFVIVSWAKEEGKGQHYRDTMYVVDLKEKTCQDLHQR